MIGQVQIYPSDITLGGIDGCIVVTCGIAMEVLECAEWIRDNEVEIKKMVESGVKPTEVVENGGYF